MNKWKLSIIGCIFLYYFFICFFPIQAFCSDDNTVKDKGMEIIMVIDASQSLAAKADTIKAIANGLYDKLRTNDNISIVTFSNNSSKIIQVNKSNITKKIGEYYDSSVKNNYQNSYPVNGLTKVFSFFKNSSPYPQQVGVVLFISDGENSMKSIELKAIVEGLGKIGFTVIPILVEPGYKYLKKYKDEKWKTNMENIEKWAQSSLFEAKTINEGWISKLTDYLLTIEYTSPFPRNEYEKITHKINTISNTLNWLRGILFFALVLIVVLSIFFIAKKREGKEQSGMIAEMEGKIEKLNIDFIAKKREGKKQSGMIAEMEGEIKKLNIEMNQQEKRIEKQSQKLTRQTREIEELQERASLDINLWGNLLYPNCDEPYNLSSARRKYSVLDSKNGSTKEIFKLIADKDENGKKIMRINYNSVDIRCETRNGEKHGNWLDSSVYKIIVHDSEDEVLTYYYEFFNPKLEEKLTEPAESTEFLLREKELSEIIKNFTDKTIKPKDILIIGFGNCGKTSLLNYIRDECTELSEYYNIYSCGGQMCQCNTTKSKEIILIDNLEHITKIDDRIESFSQRNNAFVIYTSRKEKNELMQLLARSPNRRILESCKPITLDGLSENSIKKLINSVLKSIGLNENFLSEDIKTKIYRETGGHPYYIKLILSELMKLWEKDCNITIVKETELTYAIAKAIESIMESSFEDLIDYDKNEQYQSITIENIMRQIIIYTKNGKAEYELVKKALIKMTNSISERQDVDNRLNCYLAKLALLADRKFLKRYKNGDNFIQEKVPMLFRKIAIFDNNQPVILVDEKLDVPNFLRDSITKVSENSYVIDIEHCYDELEQTLPDNYFEELLNHIPNYSFCKDKAMTLRELFKTKQHNKPE